MSEQKYYRVKRVCWLEEVPPPKAGGVASAAIRSCCECHRVLRAEGGGADYLCEDCSKSELWKYWPREAPAAWKP